MGESYAFKDYIQNGLGADLIRLACMSNTCELVGKKLYLAPNDIWEHTPINSSDRGWNYYFEQTIPIDVNNEYPRTKLPTGDIILPDNKTHLSKFEYFSELLRKIYKPKKEYIDVVNTHISKHLPELLSSEYAMIHIRRGDKVAGPWRESHAIPVDRYLDELKTWVQQDESKPLYVYIMTDTDEVIREIQDKTQEYLAIQFIWDRTETRRDGYSYKLHIHGYSDAEKIDEMITNFKNIWLMEHAKVLIGARSSFLFLTGELLNGKPAVSLENNEQYPVNI